MGRTLEPFRDPTLPERFIRWLEVLRSRIGSLPKFTSSSSSPEGAIDGQIGDLHHDGTQWWTKTTAVGNTGWAPLILVRASTTAAIEDIADEINTGDAKRAGWSVFNTTTGAPVWAVGATAGAVWNDATGSTAHTPA